MPTVGPTLPPHLPTKRKSDDESPPPRGKRFRSSSPVTEAPPKRRPIGPAPPPADLSTLPHSNANGDSDTSDDEFGPSLPPAPGSHKHASEEQRIQALADKETAARQASKKPQREEWMLIPPSADGLNRGTDPTKLKNRKFNTGKGSKAPTAKAGGIGETWTETPEQKRQRLEDEVLGVKKPAQLGPTDDVRDRRKEEEAREADRRIYKYNERNRGGSLMDENSWTGAGGAKQKEKEDDPSARAFDKEKDMKIGGTVGYQQKKELLTKARNMGDRFAKGSYL